MDTLVAITRNRGRADVLAVDSVASHRVRTCLSDRVREYTILTGVTSLFLYLSIGGVKSTSKTTRAYRLTGLQNLG